MRGIHLHVTAYHFTILIDESFHCGTSCLLGNTIHMNIFFYWFYPSHSSHGNSSDLK
jgi:hypothetical protein